MSCKKKATHLNNAKLTAVSWLQEAAALEKSGATDAAISEYLAINKKHPWREESYDRLMILYRKTKQHKRAAGLIDLAIDKFKNRYGSPAAETDKKVARLSKSLSNSLGLTDKNGRSLYDAGPVGRWTKRKMALESLIKRNKHPKR